MLSSHALLPRLPHSSSKLDTLVRDMRHGAGVQPSSSSQAFACSSPAAEDNSGSGLENADSDEDEDGAGQDVAAALLERIDCMDAGGASVALIYLRCCLASVCLLKACFCCMEVMHAPVM